MYECVRHNVDFLLAGSIRDDGPLPEVITDVLVAQRLMREKIQDVTFCLMIATTLHSIAVGNLLPAWVKVVCVDINPSTVIKLNDRGSFQTVGLVTDVEPFLRSLVVELDALSGGDAAGGFAGNGWSAGAASVGVFASGRPMPRFPGSQHLEPFYVDPVDSLFGLTIPHGKLQECIDSLEDGLKCVKETPYHAVLDCNFLHHVGAVAEFAADFFHRASREGPIRAMYFEMNGFTINTGRWYFNGFGYAKGGKISDLTWRTEWLNPWDYETEEFTLTGMERVQEAFGDLLVDGREPLGIKLAEHITEHLVVARFNELIGAAHKVAKKACPALRGFPIVSTAHDWDTLYPST